MIEERLFQGWSGIIRTIFVGALAYAAGLILSSGAGAEAREALGWVIVGGLGLATLSTLYLTPVVYLLLARFSVPKVEEEKRLARELAAAGA